MANENMRMSGAGRSTLKRRESVVLGYYDDAVKNCTSGIGKLVHLGPCTKEESERSVSPEQAARQFSLALAEAEYAVRRYVTHAQLTQDQFDSLVSFTFNNGASGARSTLDAADRGANDEVVRRMSEHVYGHVRDSHGRRLAPVRLKGLVVRRLTESEPFRTPAGERR